MHALHSVPTSWLDASPFLLHDLETKPRLLHFVSLQAYQGLFDTLGGLAAKVQVQSHARTWASS